MDLKNRDKLVISSDEFSMIVEERALNDHMTCFEVLMNMVELDEVGIDNIPDLLSDRLKNRLEIDAQKMNLLKKEAILKKTLL